MLKTLEHTEELIQTWTTFWSEQDINRKYIIRNRIKNRKRWNIDKLDETEVQGHYQQEIQKKLQGKPPSNDIEE